MNSNRQYVELGSKIDKKDTFCKAVQRILSTEEMVSRLETMCGLEIRDLHCLAEREEVEEAMRRDYPNNPKVGVTSVDFREQMIMITVPKESAYQLRHCGKISGGLFAE